MIAPSKLFKIMTKRFRQSRRRRKVVPIQGVPEDISHERLSELCLQHTGGSLKRVSYIHVSGWKRAGAYRLFLENNRGREWRVIYKNAIYELDHIPALKGFPVKPGPPEFIVYSQARGALVKYLPDVYQCIERVPGRHYQYLLEDLGGEFENISAKIGRKAKFRVAAELPAFHDAMREWLSEINSDGLLDYNSRFSLALIEYAETALTDFVRNTSSAIVRDVWELWPSIAEVYLDSEFQDAKRDAPIHGDSNSANIMVHKKYPDRLKFIDWEWAGLGIAYTDLVSLFRRSDPATNAKILAIYSENKGRHVLSEAARQYEWCRLERGILDAAYIAAQYMGSSEFAERRQAWAPLFIERSLSTVRCAYRVLCSKNMRSEKITVY